MKNTYDESLMRDLLESQKSEITEHHIYTKLSGKIRDPHNSDVLKRIGRDELRHYEFWKQHTKQDVRPSRLRIFIFFWTARIFGLTFGIKLMERGEDQAQTTYARIAEVIPEAKSIIEDEDRHEHELVEMLEEEHLKYVGSVVLGLNDALVELTGTLAGLTFALQNTRLTALAGLITGIAASLSMAASEYLSTKSDESGEDPLRSSVYTGIAYIVTVFVLIIPYLIFSHYLVCLGLTIANAILIILVFNYYISVAKDLSFRKRFFEMVSISLGVALISFGIGYLIRVVLGVEV